MKENIPGDKDKFVKAAELRDLFNRVGAVAQAGFEHAEIENPVIDLSTDTVDQSGDIFEPQS